MESHYLSKRSKKVREKIERFIEGRRRLYGDNYFTKEYLIEDIKRIFNAMIMVREKFKKEHSDSDLEQRLKGYFPNWTISIGRTMYDYVFYERMINDNLEIFYNGLSTAQRILFLGDKCHVMKYWDSYIIINFREELAVFDNNLINAYLNQIPGPFKAGHPTNVSLSNGLYLVLHSKLQEASDYLNERSKMKTLTKYDSSRLLAIKAIADKDEKSFIFEVSNLLELYPRQHISNNLADYLNLDVLGLYNLAQKVWGETPTEPKSEYWDSEFFEYERDPTRKPKIFIDFSRLSPLFAKWVNELPPKLNITHLIADIESAKSSW